jgi:hypothetical protein
VWEHEISSERPLAESVQEIRPADCISESTPALALMETFTDSDKGWRLVLTGTLLSGFVLWTDLSRPELRVCVLALLLEVEEKCAELLTWDPGDAKAAFDRLSEGRRQKAAELIIRRASTEGGLNHLYLPEEVVYSTTFADKATMVAPLEQFAGISRRQLQRNFARMERIRNSLAHTRMQREQLAEFREVIRSAEDVCDGCLLPPSSPDCA